MRVAQGLDAPDPNPEASSATYFHREAYFQLDTAKSLRHPYTENEAVAALHLVCYSQLSGGKTSWQTMAMVLWDWLEQTGLITDENPAITLHTMSSTGQILVKAALVSKYSNGLALTTNPHQWLDTFASLTSVRQPRYLGLLKRLLGERAGGYWPPAIAGDSDGLHSLRMDLLTGCPDDAILALAEIANLAFWKSTQQRNGTLSYRELVRRGDDIEQRLKQHIQGPANLSDFLDPAPLHPNLVQNTGTEPTLASFPNEDVRRLVAAIFREAAVLSLHTVLSNATPGSFHIKKPRRLIIKPDLHFILRRRRNRRVR